MIARALARLALAPLLGAALAGCDPEQTRLDVTLQPDGSAAVRVVRESTATTVFPGEDASRRAALEAERFVTAWEGVAAWTDVRATPLPGDRVRVEATAWLHSLGDLRVGGAGRFTTRQRGGLREVRYVDPLRDAVAAVFLEDPDKVRATLQLDDAAFARALRDVRASLGGALATWSFELTLRLPGPIVAVEGFAAAPGDAAVLRQDVATILALADRHLAAMREVRREVAAGALTPDEGYARLVTLEEEDRAAARGGAFVACRLPIEPDLPFRAGGRAP